MKIAIPLLMVLLVAINYQTGTINHYLPEKKITPKELAENGFYRYSYTEVPDYDEYSTKETTLKSPIKYDIYSNVRPEKNRKGELRPAKLARFGNVDTAQTKKSNDYLKELNYKTITYVFRNNILFYKNVNVLYHDNPGKEIADLTTKEKIIKYYSSLKIPVKIIVDNKYSTESYPTLFMINNYKTTINYNYSGYDMLINYTTGEMPHWNSMENWYSKSKFYKLPK